MATAAVEPRAVVHVTTETPGQGLVLVDVEGELEASAVDRWSELLDFATRKGATGIAVDLRGCRAVDSACLAVLLAVSAGLKVRGGGGIKLVTSPGSLLGLKLGAVFATELPAYATAAEALLSLRDTRRSDTHDSVPNEPRSRS
jgi:ABC-type transporter Mla MlaB component